MSESYDDKAQGSDTLPAPGCDAPIAEDTAKDVQTAREASHLHREADVVAEKGK
jgi:hypothetical protein